jgi:outer membrane protein insertion porin family
MPRLLLSIVLILISGALFAQSAPPSTNGSTSYTIGGIRIEGTEKLDPDAIKLLSGLKVGEEIRIPGDDIPQAIKNIWKQGLFADIQILQEKVVGQNIFLTIKIKELSRLSKYRFNGLKKSEVDDLREELNLYSEKIVTENLVLATRRRIRTFFVDKGFLNVETEVKRLQDSTRSNHVVLEINVDKGKRVKIQRIEVIGNTAFTRGKVRRSLKETKQKLIFKPLEDLDGTLAKARRAAFDKDDSTTAARVLGDYFEERVKLNVFKTSKFIKSNFEGDKRELVTKYNQKGYRDARVISDSVSILDDKNILLFLTIDEGERYYFRDINWSGNSIYSTDHLSKLLGIWSGDIYDNDKLNRRLTMDPNGGDISSLYMDDGYLFFQITPVEVRVDGDSIDIDIQIYEGQQARINRVTVTGNTKTNDHIVLREVRTKPGDLFSRSDIIRTQRELSVLGFFDPEQMNVNPVPNPEDGTVDIEYIVAEKPADQIELSGGFGAGQLVGNLGVSFSNFSTKNFFKREFYDPLPSGDGQKLSVRFSSNGRWFQSWNMSFTEPWLGGRKPRAFSISAYQSLQTNGQTRYIRKNASSLWAKRDSLGNKIPNELRQDIQVTGVSIGLAQQVKWPDDYFVRRIELAYQHYRMNDWIQFLLSDGEANNVFMRFSLSRNSQDQEIFPRMGSNIKLVVQATPPYSMFNNKDYTDISNQERYKWIEYHKWKFASEWFTKIYGNLVLRTKAGFGFLGKYNPDVGDSPFERFYLGGSGLTGFQLDGREIIALRGYDDQTVSPRIGASLITKYTAELRYPFSLNPSATVYGLGFVEAGNTWNNFNDYNPFAVKRSVGLGIRVFLPMFGLLGLDYGWRLDDTPEHIPQSQKGQLHFTIGAVLGEL